MYNNQDRIFLQLVDETEEVMIVKSILKSPLGLAQDIINAILKKDILKLMTICFIHIFML